MIAFDTNIWVRILVNDDAIQADLAEQLLGNDSEIFLPKTVLLEIEWVLRAVYKIPAGTIQGAIHKILGLPKLSVESPDQVKAAMELYGAGMDFADALHIASCGEFDCFYSFDVALVKIGMEQGVPVSEPAR